MRLNKIKGVINIIERKRAYATGFGFGGVGWMKIKKEIMNYS